MRKGLTQEPRHGFDELHEFRVGLGVRFGVSRDLLEGLFNHLKGLLIPGPLPVPEHKKKIMGGWEFWGITETPIFFVKTFGKFIMSPF